MTNENITVTEKLIEFIKKSPTSFQAVGEISEILDSEGFKKLSEGAHWDLESNGKYYVTRNQSSVIAFSVPNVDAESFMITASHTDSPAYKLKAEAETDAFGKYVKLNVEGYGGMIVSTWLDRPLSVAGRVVVCEDGRIVSKLVNIERDLVLIPNVAIHFNRNINNGFAYNAAVDMMPLYSSKAEQESILSVISETVGCNPDDILASDLYLYNRTPAAIWGAKREFFSSPRIDNLQGAYTTLIGFTEAVRGGDCTAIPIYASFDNEETGNATKQGAASQFLYDTLKRIALYYGIELECALASSFMVSADNGHAKHPNHPEMSDSFNCPHMNEGIVIKSNAGQKYTTDAVSAAVFREICRKADVPVQFFANRSDIVGGGTLGSSSNTKVALNTVDVGLAQLAMHSSYETAGCADTLYMIKAIDAFYKSKITAHCDGTYSLE